MMVYRFCQQQYNNDISGLGASLFGGRWNNKGFPALYTSESISLSLLEVLVNALDISKLEQLALMTLEIPAPNEKSVYKATNLKPYWHLDFDYTRWIGSEFLQKKDHLYFECPSAVIFQEKNYMINPLHKDFKQIEILTAEKFVFDKRLFKKQFTTN